MSNILVVEDDDMIAEVMTDIIKAQGHRANWVRSGLEALEMVENEHYDLVSIDLELPLMTGIEVAERIAALKPDIRILFSTGYSEQEERIDLSKPNVIGIIRKPFEIEDLQRAIENALDNP